MKEMNREITLAELKEMIEDGRKMKKGSIPTMASIKEMIGEKTYFINYDQAGTRIYVNRDGWAYVSEDGRGTRFWIFDKYYRKYQFTTCTYLNGVSACITDDNPEIPWYWMLLMHAHSRMEINQEERERTLDLFLFGDMIDNRVTDEYMLMSMTSDETEYMDNKQECVSKAIAGLTEHQKELVNNLYDGKNCTQVAKERNVSASAVAKTKREIQKRVRPFVLDYL